MLYRLKVMSLSARRAWIEMIFWICRMFSFASLSARRAWIEIQVGQKRLRQKLVALRKESVDRNPLSLLPLQHLLRRSPQGERG